MDKNFLTEHNLLEAQKRFQMIVEYSSLSNVIGEEGEQQPDPNAMGADPSMGGGAPGADPSMGGGMPGADPAMGADPSMGGGMPGADPSMGGGAPGADPAMGADPSMGNQGVTNFQPQMGDTTPEEDDEEVINVDELTDSQDETKDKVEDVSRKLEKFIGLVDKLASDIDKNNEHLIQLKQDFEKRNPTQVEKMTLRAKQGYPFAQSPDEYWDEKEQEGNYSPEDDNNGVGDQRYQITKNDVDNLTDWASIYKSINDGSFHQDLKDILSF